MDECHLNFTVFTTQSAHTVSVIAVEGSFTSDTPKGFGSARRAK